MSQTSVFPADSLDPSVHQTEASLLNPGGNLHSSPALSDWSLMIVKLNTQFHSADQKANIQQFCNRELHAIKRFNEAEMDG